MTIAQSRKLRRYIPVDRPTLWLALDESLVGGPFGGLRSMQTLLQDDLLSSVDAVVGFGGLLSRHYDRFRSTVFFENVSANTTLQQPVRKVLSASVEGAAARGADGLAYQLNLSDASELESIVQLGKVSEAAQQIGLPLLVMAYFRRTDGAGKADEYEQLKKDRPDLFAFGTAHAVRVAADMGATIIKTQFTDVDTFPCVVDAADGIPLLVAGGSPEAQQGTLELASTAIAGGADGLCFGRRIFNASSPAANARALIREISKSRDTLPGAARLA